MAVVATGFFDGVHLGHRLVIDTLLSAAHERGEQSVIVTFWPHPRTVLQDDARSLRLLTSLGEKKALLTAMGVDRVEVLDFSREFCRMTAEQYLRDYVVGRFGGSAIVLGYDNRFGSDHLGPQEISSLASSLGIGVIPVPAVPQEFGHCPEGSQPAADPSHLTMGPSLFRAEGGTSPQGSARILAGPETGGTGSADIFGRELPLGKDAATAISSTKIRTALSAGDVQGAAAMLGYRYGLHGVVVAGNRLGRTIGFPTANMHLYEPLKLVPANGVYMVEVETLGSHYHGMTNIGVKPTVSGSGLRTIETHIFDFDEFIYGLDIRIRFISKIRDERRFASLEELRKQLDADKALCLDFLGQ